MKLVLERRIQLNQEYHEKLLSNAVRSRDELDALVKRIEARGEEVGEHWEADFEEEDMFILDTTELFLVSLYHAIERDLKLILRWAKRGIKVRGMNLDDLTDELGLLNYDSYFEIDLLREISNCWKHEASPRPSQAIWALLLLPEKPDGDYGDSPGLLNNHRFSDELADLINAGPHEPGRVNIAKAYLKIGYTFLYQVLEATPFPK